MLTASVSFAGGNLEVRVYKNVDGTYRTEIWYLATEVPVEGNRIHDRMSDNRFANKAILMEYLADTCIE